MTLRIEDPERKALREENERLTQEFLDRGGEVTVCDYRPVCVPSKKFWEDRGGDYTPWNWIGTKFEDNAQYIVLYGLGDGGFITPAITKRADS